MKKYAIILAAGKGTRMNSDLPKCIIDFCGKPMIEYIISTCEKCKFDEIIVVVGHKKEEVIDVIGNDVTYIVQKEQLGTAHAVLSCEDYFLDKSGFCVIIPGDMPLVNVKTIKRLIRNHQFKRNDLTFASTIMINPSDYGRVYRENKIAKKIIEYKDATDEERLITEVNCGIYCANINSLFNYLKEIKNDNKNNEFYITDLISIVSKKNKLGCVKYKNNVFLMSINDKETLDEVSRVYDNN